MKTFFVCSEGLSINHEGEEYDEILLVKDIPELNELEKISLEMRDILLKLWDMEKEVIRVECDCHAGIKTILINMKYVMFEMFGVKIDIDE